MFALYLKRNELMSKVTKVKAMKILSMRMGTTISKMQAMKMWVWLQARARPSLANNVDGPRQQSKLTNVGPAPGPS
jgi:hypothetical protein